MKALKKAQFRANTIKGLISGIKSSRNTNQLIMLDYLASGLVELLDEIEANINEVNINQNGGLNERN